MKPSWLISASFALILICPGGLFPAEPAVLGDPRTSGTLEEVRTSGQASFDALSTVRAPKEKPSSDVLLSNCPGLHGMEPLSDIKGPTLKSLKPLPGGLPDFVDDMDKESLLEALAHSLDYWARVPSGRKVKVGGRETTAAHMKRSIEALVQAVRESATSQELNARLRRDFDAYESVGSDGNGTVTITGYFEAEIDAVRQKDTAHPFPVHLRPADLLRIDPSLGASYDYGRIDEKGRVVPHYSRAEVMRGALDGRGLEMAWVAHPDELLILQTEGSGFLRLPGGARQKVGFNGANGWPYRSVGRALIDCGLLPPDATGKVVHDFLKSQPIEREIALVDINPRYTYFTPLSENSGTYGAIEEPLTPGRSIAIDPVPVPLGSAGLLVSKIPVADEEGNVIGVRPFARLIATQDTGSAIRGPGRVDLFFGGGLSRMAAGQAMFYTGKLYILVLKDGGPL